MCLVLAWNTRLTTKALALRLSHQVTGVVNKGKGVYFRKYSIKIRSHATCANVQYFDSVLDLEITLCFFEDSETKASPR